MLEVFARPHFSKDNHFVESLFGPTKRVPKLNGRLWTVSKRLSILPVFWWPSDEHLGSETYNVTLDQSHPGLRDKISCST